MEFMILGLVVALNFIIIKMKFDKQRYEDGVFDMALLGVITILFQGSYAGLVVGTIASLFISIFFLASPPTFFSGEKGFLQEFKRRASNGSAYKPLDL